MWHNHDRSRYTFLSINMLPMAFLAFKADVNSDAERLGKQVQHLMANFPLFYLVYQMMNADRRSGPRSLLRGAG